MMTRRSDPDGPSGGPRPRASRWGLYLPLFLLALVVSGWSAFWLVARHLVEQRLDQEIAQAAERGDVWICAGRTLTGYPFRLELRCSDVTLVRAATAGVVRLSTGPMLAIGQPHTPHHVIVQAEGPLTAELADGARIEARWELVEASRRTQGGALERLSIEARKPVVTISGPAARGGAPAPTAATLSFAALEAHLRRNPTRPEADRARDLFIRASQLASGELDALFGDANTSDLDMQATVTMADFLDKGLTPAAIEAWRAAQGKLEVARFNLKKGIKQFDARGELQLDEEKRLAGRIEPSIANIDQFAGIRLRGGAMDLASALSGRAQPSDPSGLRPMPAIDVRGGRVFLGPIRLPLPPLQPLY